MIINQLYQRFSRWLNNKNLPPLTTTLRQYADNNLIEPDALSMIEGVLHVSSIQVRDIMVPRINMCMLEDNMSVRAILATIVESGHSRFPVINNDSDKVVGILLAKDLLHHYETEKESFRMEDFMRPPVFIPESKRLNVLLKEFRTSHNHMAIIVDEYSNIAGLVTIEDVIEEIIGEIEDEYDYQIVRSNIRMNSADCYMVDGVTSISEFNEFFATDISDESYDTVAGLVVNAFGHLPKRGEKVSYQQFNIKVLKADRKRVLLLLFSKKIST